MTSTAVSRSNSKSSSIGQASHASLSLTGHAQFLTLDSIPLTASQDNLVEEEGSARSPTTGLKALDEQHGDIILPGQEHYRLHLNKTLTAAGSEIFCLRYSQDGRFLVAGCGDGSLSIYTCGSDMPPMRLEMNMDGDVLSPRKRSFPTSNTALLLQRQSTGKIQIKLPCTCIVFRPEVRESLTANVMLAGYSDGSVMHWHIPSGKRLSVFTVDASVPGLEILSAAYAPDSSYFAVGASDGKIRLFDEETRALRATLQPGVGYGGVSGNSGHSGRVFSLKFHLTNPSILVSAGWDNCVHIWNLGPAGETLSVRTIFGPHICGDALDVTETSIVTGSWRMKDQLEVWSMETLKQKSSTSWGAHIKTGGDEQSCRLYAAAFSHKIEKQQSNTSSNKDLQAGASQYPTSTFLAAGGGSGSNEARVYRNVEDGGFTQDSVVGSFLGLASSVMGITFSPSGTSLAIGLGNGTIHLVDLVVTNKLAPHEKMLVL